MIIHLLKMRNYQKKQPACKPQKKCDICYLNTNGVPESINYNTKTKNTNNEYAKNMSIRMIM